LKSKKDEGEIPDDNIQLRPGRLSNKKTKSRIYELVSLTGSFGRGIISLLEETGPKSKRKRISSFYY
jgi:hypothetical protein